jgi:hypothetical protein
MITTGVSIMNHQFKQAVLPALVSATLLLSGCGGSGTTDENVNLNSVGAKSISGIITGFGSIFVNGVEFETGTASFDIDDDSNSSQSALRVGMRVKLKGTVNDDGVTGTAESVVYQSELKGPVDVLVPIFDTTDPTLLVAVTLTIFGQQVMVTSDTTFDDDFGLTMDSLQVGDVLEISGFSSTDGIVATHIEKQKAGSFEVSDHVEIKGEISDLAAGSFVIRGLQIQYDDSTVFDDGLTAVSLAEGLYVEVKGIYDPSSEMFSASKIETGKDRLDDHDGEAEIEGVVADFDAASQTFSIQGQRVDFSQSPTLFPAGLQLADDLKVEVEGSIADGTLVASKIKQRGQKIKVQAQIASINGIDSADPSISLSLFGGEGNINVRVNIQTEIKDNQGENEDIVLGDLMVGDFVEIKAFYDGTSVINAVELERDSMDKIRLQGPLSSFDETAQTVNMFGQEFDLSQASFQGDGMDLSVSEFYAMLADGVFVKLTDKNTDGVIDEAELDD